jgi:hypothetical protein
MQKFWMVQGYTAPKVKYYTEDEAMKEAERLAIANPAQIFHVMCAYMKCVHNTVTWEIARWDGTKPTI